MKSPFLICLSIICWTSPTYAQVPSDIIFQTRMESVPLTYILEKTRLIMANTKMKDILTDETPVVTDPIFTMDEIASDPDVARLKDFFASVFKRDLDHAQIRLRIPKVYYEIKTLLIHPKQMAIHDPNLEMTAEAGISGLTAKLSQGLEADLMIPNPVTHELESYLTAKLDPVMVTIPTTIEPMPLEVSFEARRDHDFTFQLLNKPDLSRVTPYLERHKDVMPILAVATGTEVSAAEIHIRPVTLRLNSLTRTVHFNTFRPIIQKSLPKMVSGVLSALGKSLGNKLGNKILKSVFSSKLRTNLIISNDNVYSRSTVEHFAQPVSDQIQLGFKAEFCTKKNFNLYQEACVEHEDPFEPPRELTLQDHESGLKDVSDLLAARKGDIVLSLSENYINHMLKTTADADLWDKHLNKDHLALGPKGVFTIFNQRTQNPEMFIDLYYLGDKGLQRIFINDRHPIRFPLRLSLSASIQTIKGVPHLVIKTEKLLSDMDEILNGIPEYDMESHVVQLFKKKIANLILEKAQELEGQVALDLDLPQLQGVPLDQTTYEVSPYGRLNWIFKL